MSILGIYQQEHPEQPLKMLTHHEDIAAELAPLAVTLERWQPDAPLSATATGDELLAAYRQPVAALLEGWGYSEHALLRHDHPSLAGRLGEHRQVGGEALLCLSGRALISLPHGEYVYRVLCERHDLLILPAGTLHWLDMGDNPYFVVIRCTRDGESEASGNPIAERFPGLDDLGL
ncbi:acireductone dioxygenase [Stutzerimonas kirkiae]|uniref:acireductone dioxygenase n=1 Tax=Stutzerimonas kirkiae TaxID=2211392 RepID=UPI00103853F4|nr:acireductone dioxygenase [Stutzerimonas kirkiae]TBV09623.1 acireductone dioxygenase [Stutzerimonas kirkiae]TBV16844.1 acireductone dioxygenase [Stutzerimonas kirkiae]